MREEFRVMDDNERYSLPKEQRENRTGLELIYGTDQAEVIIAAAHVWTTGEAKFTTPDIALARARLKAFLEPLGMWNEVWFGMWVILYCSY